MAEVTFTEAPDLRGKRAAVVAGMIEKLVEAEGEPVSWEQLIKGVEHPHQYTPALMALEMVGAVERWEYIKPGSSKHSTAYSLAEAVGVER